MTVAVGADVQWMTQATSRLADALGWPVGWMPPAGSPPAEFDTDHGFDVHDGLQTVGRLAVESPDDPRLHAAFQAAREVTEVFADVLSRLACAARKLDTQSQEISTLVEIGKTASQSGDLPRVLAQLLQGAARLSGLWSAAFFLIDPRESRLRLRATHQLPAKSVPQPRRSTEANSPDGLAALQGAVMLDRRLPQHAAWLPPGISVGIGVPVFVDSCLVGSLWCFDRRQRELGDREAQVLQSVAVQIAAALERTVLLEESDQRQQLNSEMRFASKKLPTGLLKHPPADWGLDLSVRSATVAGVGGDLCDVIPLGDRRTLIAIGDAVGHGIPAAMLISVARGALWALVSQTSSESLTTESLMAGVNRALFAVTHAEQFVTLMLGIVDSRLQTITYTNAGHPPPLHLRDGTWSSFNSHGLFLGISPDVKYQSTSLPLSAGDVLVGFTDGVTETINRSRQVFRRQGIKDTILAGEDATADTVAETIWQGLEGHDPDRPLRDDRTLLVLKYLGVS